MGDVKSKSQEHLHKLGFKLGVYRHYKGGEYVAFMVTLDEETLEALVHYYSLKKKTRWTRTLLNFEETLANNRLMENPFPRFDYVRAATPEEACEAALIDSGSWAGLKIEPGGK
jgi:hypothetical protein